MIVKDAVLELRPRVETRLRAKGLMERIDDEEEEREQLDRRQEGCNMV